MEHNLKNRAELPVGKTIGDKKQPPQEATPVVLNRHVPALVCPKCGRGMTPRVERWRPATAASPFGQADCICTLSNCRFIYTPPVVQIK